MEVVTCGREVLEYLEDGGTDIIRSAIKQLSTRGQFPTLEQAVTGDAETVQLCLAHSTPSKSEIYDAFQTVHTESAATVLVQSFPDIKPNLECFKHAVLHRIASIASLITNPEYLTELCNCNYPYWKNFGRDLVWFLNLVRDRLSTLEFRLTPVVIRYILDEKDGALLRSLVIEFPLVTE
jgi:hypothetical protein